ncbi:hypothetical protein C4M96_03825 [Mycoplasmopsis pullorum]|uniref:hypothetical protein n=2 Tax=Mycoplasmopsis pullorum TaxID=48003 RepID=UPI00111A91D1|nr:hypothetical protein [Mycoplasmopsis pullorum]TNK91652.1 hypothetical protein C4M96_03825 [Mycoplasmopsis pullorum]
MNWTFYIYHSGERFTYSVFINDKNLKALKWYLKHFEKYCIPYSSIHCKYCLSFVIKMLEKNEYKSYLVYENKELTNDKEIVFSTIYGFREKCEDFVSYWKGGETNTLPIKKLKRKIENLFYRFINKATQETSTKISKINNLNKNIVIKTPFINYIVENVCSELVLDDDWNANKNWICELENDDK